jgi:hypothetical protein
MVKLVCGLEQRKKLEVIPLSNDVTHFRIVDIYFNILKHVTDEADSKGFFRWYITLRITEVFSSKGPNWVGVFPLTWGRKQIQFGKCRVF